MATTTLRVILDDIAAPASRSLRRYTTEITSALINAAPPHCDVAAIVSHGVETRPGLIDEMFAGLAELTTLRLGHEALSRAWQHGITSIPTTRMSDKGLIHSPSLFAPLSRHDRVNDTGTQTVVTIHDVVAWTHPESLSSRQVSWQKAMTRRAHKYADAVVVTSHSVANELNDNINFGDRLRVVPSAPSSRLASPYNADARAFALELPERFIFTTSTLCPHSNLDSLLNAMAHPDAPDIPLLISGPPAWGQKSLDSEIVKAGLHEKKVRYLGVLDDADLAVALDRATVFASPDTVGGLSLSILEAFAAGTPVVHTDQAPVLEISAGAGITVPASDPETYPERMATTLSQVVADDELAQQLGQQGLDRAGVHSWQSAAEKIWQLHADL